MIVLFPVTRSCLVNPVVQSLHHENVYHVFAFACTNTHVVLYVTFCVAVHEIVHPVLPVYVNVYVFNLNTHVNVLSPVIHPYTLGFWIFPSLHHEKL